MNRPTLITLTALALSGCSWMADTSDEPLIGDLEFPPVTIHERPATPVAKQEIIENYRQLLTLTPDQRLGSEATRRLADLELDLSEDQLLDEQTAAEPIELGSIALYESLLRNDPDYPNRDLVIYQLSRAYELAGEMDRMMAALDRLVSQYPDSPYWDEAQFRRGERLFVLQRYGQAEAAYGAILDHRPDSPFFDRALFKQGWSRFKQSRTEDGLDAFVQLLDRKLGNGSDLAPDALSRADRELLKETLRVIGLAFAELGGTQRITRYFDQKGHRNYEFMIYQGLGDLYQKQGRIADAADAYLAFAERYPTHPQAPRLSVEVIDLYTKNNFPGQALDSKKAFTTRYQIKGRYWDQLDSENQIWLKERLRTYLRELAEYHHALAQQAAKSKAKGARAEQARQGNEAVHWYRRYLESFADDESAGEMSFLLAELLFDLGRYPEAVAAYEDSAYKYPGHDKRAEAGYAALLAYAAEEQRLPEAQRSAWRRKGIDSALRFADTFREDARRAAVLTQAADQLLGLNELTLATEVAQQVTGMQPPAQAALRRTAWTVTAHAAFEQKRYADAEQAYRQTLALTGTRDKARAPLEERLAASIYQQAVALRDQGEQRKAAAQFLRVGQAVPSATIRETADFDAAASLIAAKDWPRTIQVLEDFRSRYPKSPRLPDISTKLAYAYLQAEQPLKAATELSVIARQGATPELRREAAWQAAELNEQAGANDQAITAFKTYVRTFPKPFEQAIEARFRLAELYKAEGRIPERNYWLKAIIKADSDAGKSRTDRSRFLAAHASLELARPAFDDFRRITLKAPLKKNLKRKKQRMKQAIAAYRQAAEYGVSEVTTAATYRIGEIYQLFGQALMESERPKGLNAEELDQYELLLEDQAYPFENKAIALHETNVKRAASGTYDTWVGKSYAALAELLPARYGKRELSEEVVDAIR